VIIAGATDRATLPPSCRASGHRAAKGTLIVWRLGPMAFGLMGLDGAKLGRCVLCLEPKDRQVADVVGSADLDQRLLPSRPGVQISGVKVHLIDLCGEAALRHTGRITSGLR
jgi:hypothetical protein